MAKVCSHPLSLLMACLFLTGCASGHRRPQDPRIARHPFQETRMSSHPVEGYTPSGVFRVRGARNTVYLVGTSHVVADDQIPFPSSFYAAYQDSQEVYVETEPSLSFFTSLRLIPKLIKWGKAHQTELFCPKERNLGSYLSAGTVERLRALYGKDYAHKERMTPLFLLLMAEGEDKNGVSSGGVEEAFTFQARKDGKPLRTLDDTGMMIDLIVPLMEEMLEKYRRDIARRGADAVVKENILDQPDDDLVWRRGDLAAVERDQAELRSETPLLYKTGVVERNQKWMGKLKRVLQAKQNVMVLVGIDHLGGKDGLLELLHQGGFNPEQMHGVDRPIASAAK